MKKIIAVILALVFILSLFAGCNKTPEDTQLSPENPPKSEEKGDGDNEDNKNETPDKNKEDNEVPDDNTNETNGTEVTDENVKGLFIPSLEAYVLYMGSAFYDVDRDGNGKAINYYLSEKFDVDVAESYKIVSDITVEEIENKMKTYMDTTKVSDIGIRLSEFGKEWFAEVDNELYVGLACYGTGVSNYDENSIELYKKEYDKYYISVDVYGIYPITDENHNEGDFVYSRSVIFATTLKDGVLYINDIDRDGIIKENINSETDRHLITDITKMPMR